MIEPRLHGYSPLPLTTTRASYSPKIGFQRDNLVSSASHRLRSAFRFQLLSASLAAPQVTSNTNRKKTTSMPLPRRPSSMGSESDDAVASPVQRRRATSSSMRSTSTRDSGDMQEDLEEEWDRGATRTGATPRKRKKDEPMSPAAVVCECAKCLLAS